MEIRTFAFPSYFVAIWHFANLFSSLIRTETQGRLSGMSASTCCGCFPRLRHSRRTLPHLFVLFPSDSVVSDNESLNLLKVSCLEDVLSNCCTFLKHLTCLGKKKKTASCSSYSKCDVTVLEGMDLKYRRWLVCLDVCDKIHKPWIQYLDCDKIFSSWADSVSCQRWQLKLKRRHELTMFQHR